MQESDLEWVAPEDDKAEVEEDDFDPWLSNFPEEEEEDEGEEKGKPSFLFPSVQASSTEPKGASIEPVSHSITEKEEEEVAKTEDFIDLEQEDGEVEDDPTFQPEEDEGQPMEEDLPEEFFTADPLPIPENQLTEVERDWYENIMKHCISVTDYSADHSFLDKPFCADHFLHYFIRRCNEARRTGNKRVVHAMLVSVMLSTLKACREGKYVVQLRDGKTALHMLNTNELRFHARQTIYYNDAANFTWEPNRVLQEATMVEVWQKDTAEAGREMLEQGLKPVVLNLASRSSPGGGFKLGHWAQEECLTRRSNYYQHLTELDETCPRKNWSYPMSEFGAVYSKQVCFFRGLEADGYPFLEKPFFLDLVAVAAYRNPKIKSPDRLDDKVARRTKQKIRRIFLVAWEHGHDSLLLGALGCGAFHNPPGHIAEIFAEVIQEFAGCFKKIVFAIINDHNSNGNYATFKNHFPNRAFVPKPTPRPDVRTPSSSSTGRMASRQHQSSGAQQRQRCNHGGLCTDKDRDHWRRFEHPESCRHGGLCRLLSDPDHRKTYLHPAPCREGALCKQLHDVKHRTIRLHPPLCRNGGLCRDRGDKEHLQKYIHAPPCGYAGLCTELNSRHIQQYLHPVECKYGRDCSDNEVEHLLKYHHPKQRCKDAWSCSLAKDITHMKKFSHPFLPPCKHFERCKKTSDRNHTHKFSHRCWWGGNCKQRKDASHCSLYYHIEKKPCRYGTKCRKLQDPDHLLKRSHEGVKDFLPPCKWGQFCRKKSKPRHCTQYSHPSPGQEICAIRGYNKGVCFESNRDFLFTCINEWHKGRLIAPPEIVEWVGNLRPSHRCRPEIFELIVEHGVLMSTGFQTYLTQRPVKAALSEASVDSAVKNMLSRAQLMFTDLQGWMKLVLKTCMTGNTAVMQTQIADQARAKKIPPTVLPHLLSRLQRIGKAVSTHQNKGIKYDVDQIMGTDKHVFSIVGPHNGTYYGKIILVLRSEIMHHPDFHMTPQAATSYHSGSTFTHRPWQKGKGDNKDLYHKSKINASAKDWQTVLATEIVAQFFHAHGKIPSLPEAKRFYSSHDSHRCIEGHLPGLVPLAYVEKVIMPADVWDGLHSHTKELFASQFKDTHVLLKKPTESNPFDSDVYGAMVHRPSSHMGLMFALANNYLHHVFLPTFAKLSRSRFKIRFQALGTNIFLVLSDTDDLKNKGKQAHLYHIGLNCDKDGKAWIKKGLQKTEKPLALVTGFNEGLQDFDEEHFVTYVVVVDLGSGNVVLRHPKGHPCSKRLVFQDRHPPSALGHLALGCWKRRIAIKDLIVINEQKGKGAPGGAGGRTPRKPGGHRPQRRAKGGA